MIIAVDFDGVIVKDEFPGVGPPDYGLVHALRNIQDNVDLILWTSRVGDKLNAAELTCNKLGLRFAGVNMASPKNLREYGTDPRKVYADVYIDDRSIGYSRWDTIMYLNKLKEEFK